MDAGTGQEHLKRRNLYRQQRTQQAEQHFLQEQEKGTQAAGGMVSSGEHPRSHYFQGKSLNRCRNRSPARRRQQKDATTQIFSGLVKCADCGWSMRFGTNSQNKQAVQPLHLQPIRSRLEAMLRTLYPL